MFAVIEVGFGYGTSLVVWLGLRCRGRVNSVIIDVTTEMNYRCNYSIVF